MQSLVFGIKDSRMLLVLLALKRAGVCSLSVARERVRLVRLFSAFTWLHRPRAGLFVGKHACTGLVLACSSASTRAPSRASFQEVLAIKCAKSGFRRWLPREVRHASEIGHPSVCRIFEIHTVPTERGEIDFLTMEFLDETLADLLQPAQYRRTRRTPLRSSSAEVWRKRIAQASET